MWSSLVVGILARPWARWAASIALVIAMSFLSGCAGVGSDAPPGVCPPVVELQPGRAGARGVRGGGVARGGADRGLAGRLCPAEGAGAGVSATPLTSD